MNYYLKIKPRDPIFFRTGKPFDIGSDTWATTNFFPSPSVFWGAIFAFFVRQKILNKTDTDKLKLKRVFLYDEDKYEAYLPAPFDIFKIDDRIICIDYLPTKDLISSNNLDYLIIPFTKELGVKHIKDHFIEINTIKNYFKTNTPGDDCNLDSTIKLRSKHYFYNTFPKVGIQRDDITHTSKEGFLYNLEMIELKDNISWIVEIELKDKNLDKLSGKDLLKLGGDNKLAEIEKFNNSFFESFEEFVKNHNENNTGHSFVKILFTSPTLLKKIQKIDGLLAAFIGKLQYIGGWDIINRKPKPMLLAVPPGSVMVFNANKWNDIKRNLIIKEIYIEKAAIYYENLGFNKYIEFKF